MSQCERQLGWCKRFPVSEHALHLKTACWQYIFNVWVRVLHLIELMFVSHLIKSKNDKAHIAEWINTNTMHTRHRIYFFMFIQPVWHHTSLFISEDQLCMFVDGIFWIKTKWPKTTSYWDTTHRSSSCKGCLVNDFNANTGSWFPVCSSGWWGQQKHLHKQESFSLNALFLFCSHFCCSVLTTVRVCNHHFKLKVLS